MLSDNALLFLQRLRESEGANARGTGPSSLESVIELWGDQDISTLRDTLDELAGYNFIRVDTGTPANVQHRENRLDRIAGVAILPDGQDYLDQLGSGPIKLAY